MIVDINSDALIRLDEGGNIFKRVHSMIISV